MIKNFILVAIRNLTRQKGFSFINIFGLAFGLAAALLIFIWVWDEINYDHFHANIDRLYRVEMSQDYDGEAYHVNVTPYPAGEGFEQEIPEIEHCVRMDRLGSFLVSFEDQSFYENKISAVDSTIFSVFTFPLKWGNPSTALNQPFSIVLSEETANKYFGNDDPIGRTLTLDNQYDFKITGVMEKIPNNSSFSPDMLVPFSFSKVIGDYSDYWISNSIITFALLKVNADPGPVDRKLTNVVLSHIDFDEIDGFSEEDYVTQFMLAPLKKMHLHSYFGFGNPPGQIQNVIIFITIGIFILIIAGINYMNLSTARSSKRAREIGIRKVSGANPNSLIRQFLGESLVTTFISAIVAVLLTMLLLNKFNQLSGKEIELSFLFTWKFMLGLGGIIIFTGIMAGAYPAIFLSRFEPVKVLKGSTGSRSQKAWLRKGLVIVQFTLSIFLITGTMLVYKQLNHMQSMKLGFDKENIVYLRMHGNIKNSYKSLSDKFRANPEVLYVTSSSNLPSSIGSNSGGADWDGKDPDLNLPISLSIIDYDYVETLGIQIVQGRSISRDFPSDMGTDSTGTFLINEKLASIMGVENPLEVNFSFLGIPNGRIVGIMKDFHFQSMQAEIEPLAILAGVNRWTNYIILRLRPGNIPKTLDNLEEAWTEILPDYPFDYHFLDEVFDDMYKTEVRMGSLLKYFAFISVFIALLGLFGLTAYMVETRIREIGIRKVIGSSISGIVYLMTGEFARLVIVAVAIGVPISWYFLNNWLKDYAYPTTLSWWIFGLPAIFGILVAILTVSVQVVKAASMNPANTLRYE